MIQDDLSSLARIDLENRCSVRLSYRRVRSKNQRPWMKSFSGTKSQNSQAPRNARDPRGTAWGFW
jgi:hypothetical protein